jgi:hypothetical protein
MKELIKARRALAIAALSAKAVQQRAPSHSPDFMRHCSGALP